MTSENVIDPMDGMEEQKVVYHNIKFGKIGDWFRGVLVDNTRQIQNNLSKTKEMQTIYEMKAIGGLFHDIVKKQVAAEPTVPVEGEFWSFITSKPAIVQQLKGCVPGQIIGFRFAETKESKTAGFDDTKIIKVYVGGMDPNYQGETARD